MANRCQHKLLCHVTDIFMFLLVGNKTILESARTASLFGDIWICLCRGFWYFLSLSVILFLYHRCLGNIWMRHYTDFVISYHCWESFGICDIVWATHRCANTRSFASCLYLKYFEIYMLLVGQYMRHHRDFVIPIIVENILELANIENFFFLSHCREYLKLCASCPERYKYAIVGNLIICRKLLPLYVGRLYYRWGSRCTADIYL